MYESTQNEVKRKMIKAGAGNAVPKSPAKRMRKKSPASLHTVTFLSHAAVSGLRATRILAKVCAIYNEKRFLLG